MDFSDYSIMRAGPLVTFLSLCCLKTILADQSLLYLDEIRSLSELPMDKLIRIKSSLGSGNGKPLSIVTFNKLCLLKQFRIEDY